MDQTSSELQIQIDRLSQAVQQARDTQVRLEPMEHRLAELVDRCAEVLSRWSDVDPRAAIAPGEIEARLGELGAIEKRLQQDALQRSRDIEQTVEQEWEALRHKHDEPVRQLREQAAALGEVCVAAANLSLRGFERAEARFAALERDIHGQLSQLSRDVQSVLAESRHDLARPAALGAGVAPFPLENVMRIHEELRGGRPDDPPGMRDVSPPDASGVKQLAAVNAAPSIEMPAGLSDRVDSLEREVTSDRKEVHDTATSAARLRRDWRLTLAGLAALALVVTLVGVSWHNEVSARLDDATARAAEAQKEVQAATDNANRQVAAIRADADKQINEAHQNSLKSQILSDVLAAPDLIRFTLVGGDEPDKAYAQALWSRSRGMVVSASRLPALAAGAAYQVWLLTNTTPVSGGVLVPDATGHAMIATDEPPRVPRSVIGFLVTLEPAGQQAAPTGATVLSRPAQ